MSTSSDYRRYRFYKFVTYGTAGVALFIAACLLFGLLIMFLWNATVAETFGVAAITFWQGIGLFILAKLFFGFGSPSGSGRWGSGSRKYQWAKYRDKSTDRESFRQFWEEEGKAAYDAYRNSRPGEDETKQEQ